MNKTKDNKYQSISMSIHKYLLTSAIIFLGLFSLAQSSQAATYYIDYQSGSDSNNGISKTTPWKRCPGMVGFTGSYSHSAGDVFVFKGGVTWPSAALPLTVGYSGTSSNADTYTVDKTWYSGASWSQPVFDMEQTDINAISIDTKNYITLNNLKIINPANLNVYQNMIYIVSSNGISVRNSTIDASGGAGDATPIQIRNVDGVILDGNYIRAKQSTGNPDCILIRPWYKIKNISITNNEITSPDGTGGDGIHIDAEIPAYATNPSDSAFYNDFNGNYGPILIEGNNFHDIAGKMFISILDGGHDVDIRYNMFHGQQNDRVAIDFDGAANGGVYYYDTCRVFYNLFYGINGSIAQWGGIIRVVLPDRTGSKNNIINNNVIYQNGSYPNEEKGICFYNNAAGTTWSIKNNIFYGLTNGVVGGSGAAIDKNCFYNNAFNGRVGINPLLLDPKFVSPSINDFHLQSTSSAIDVGINWGQVRDFAGNLMQGSDWDIGAYEYVSGPTPYCGDGDCNGAETCFSCPADCGTCDDPTAPSVPAGLSGTAVSPSQINLSWTASTDTGGSGLAGYRIYRCQGTGCAPATQIATSATNSYSDTNLSPSTTYVYTVAAYDGAGNASSPSSPASVTTQSASLNLALNKPVTATKQNYGDATYMVDGIKDGSFWAAQGAPNSLTVDLGSDYLINKIYIGPYGVSSGGIMCYYENAWNIKYKSSSDSNWKDFTNVVKQTGSGILSTPGISITNGQPSGSACDNNYKYYNFTFSNATARYIKYEVTQGDVDGDTNGDEIEIYEATDITPPAAPTGLVVN